MYGIFRNILIAVNNVSGDEASATAAECTEMMMLLSVSTDMSLREPRRMKTHLFGR